MVPRPSTRRTLSIGLVALFLIFIVNVAFAGCTVSATSSDCSTCTSTQKIPCAMKSICFSFEGLLPVLAFVLFILAGVAYAAGQFFGAEMRAKAIGYAMNMLTGAIIALVISIISPTIITALYSGTTAFTTTLTGCARINIPAAT